MQIGWIKIIAVERRWKITWVQYYIIIYLSMVYGVWCKEYVWCVHVLCEVLCKRTTLFRSDFMAAFAILTLRNHHLLAAKLSNRDAGVALWTDRAGERATVWMGSLRIGLDCMTDTLAANSMRIFSIRSAGSTRCPDRRVFSSYWLWLRLWLWL